VREDTFDTGFSFFKNIEFDGPTETAEDDLV
jgi:hypothetical protein